MNQVVDVALYRFRATFGRRWHGYLSLAICLGFAGGLAMGSIAAARRTQASFPVYLASTHPPDLSGIIAFVNPSPGMAGLGYNPVLEAKIAHLPHISETTTQVGLNIIPLGPDGTPESPSAYPASAGEVAGVVKAPSQSLDNPTIIQGRMFDPTRPNEFVVDAAAERIFHLHIDESVRFGIYTNAQTKLPAFGTPRVVPFHKFVAKLVGIVVLSTSIVEDDTDASGNSALLAFTPARTRPLLTCCTYYTGLAVKVAGGRDSVAAAQKEIANLIPRGFTPFQTDQAAVLEAKAERAIKPESTALGVFGGIAALATILIAAQIIGRQLRHGALELRTLRALGADPTMNMSDGLVGIVGSAIFGSLVAGAVAVGLSPLSPLGPARPVYPGAGVAFDWLVLGTGVGFFALFPILIASAIAFRMTPHHFETAQRSQIRRAPISMRAATALGLPQSATTGIRFAVDPGAGLDKTPARSAILGATLSVLVLAATVTFGASLDNLVSHPALYGWNWNYEMAANQGGVIPGNKATHLLQRDHFVAAWSPVEFETDRIDGQIAVPVMSEAPNAAVAPPVLTGHAVEANNQIVLGTATLSQLDKHLGESVILRTQVNPAIRLQIVGTATMPTIGGGSGGGGQHLEMGTGALISYNITGGPNGDSYDLPGAAPGPYAILIRLKSGSGLAGLHSLQQIATATSTRADYGVSVLSVQHPAEIVNYHSMGTTPAILGGSLAVFTLAALMLTLIASVRRRRVDLALLKTLGFTRRQLASVFAWQSSVTVGIGTMVGVPLGIAAGRILWILFANQIDVVPAPTIPVFTLIVIVIGSLVIANLVAAIPGRIAANTPTAMLLRTE